MEKIREYFDGMIVKKSSIRQVFSALSIPSFIRDWFINRYSDVDGNISVEFITEKIKDILPHQGEWNTILNELMSGEQVKFICKLNVSFDLKTNKIRFALPDFGITANDTFIPKAVWEKNKKNLLRTDGDIWGIVKLSYQVIETNKKQEGKICLDDFQSFLPYTIDLEYYKKAREKFDLDEWIDVLLMAIDYNPKSYKTEEQKLTTLSRLLPFVEKRLNLIELAPKGTGKSYMYSQISKRCWLSTGGVMTRAKMFFDMRTQQLGLVSCYDYVALDEISTIKFPDAAEMQGALKGYLESGAFTVGVKAGTGDAGMILLGNIRSEQMNVDVNMFETLPDIFNESALMDRFHGFIEGWKIPRMNENMIANGWALNTEYFSEILHALREDISAKNIVDSVLVVPLEADTRDTNAVKRLASAYVKLLFPNWRTPDDVDRELFDRYCFQPALNMRGIIKKQLGIMDIEFRNKPMAKYSIAPKE